MVTIKMIIAIVYVVVFIVFWGYVFIKIFRSAPIEEEKNITDTVKGKNRKEN
jgi:cytochrome bd-type quinol oxidase subunit 1